jgi:hypothetical protein
MPGDGPPGPEAPGSGYSATVTPLDAGQPLTVAVRYGQEDLITTLVAARSADWIAPHAAPSRLGFRRYPVHHHAGDLL